MKEIDLEKLPVFVGVRPVNIETSINQMTNYQSLKRRHDMNLMVITLLLVSTLGFLAFLTQMINRKDSKQPILIEQRKIIYRRRP